MIRRTEIRFRKAGLAAWMRRLSIPLLGVFLLNLAVEAQSINRDAINQLLDEGEIFKAETSLSEALKRGEELTYLDSLYALKNLSVLYASQPKKQVRADSLFERLLRLDPYASLHDTYASNTIIARFKKIRKAYQERIGGKALVPTLAAFDILSEGKRLSDEEKITLTHQVIAELQRLTIFHTLDRSVLSEALARMHKQPSTCEDRTCRLDMARRLTAEKMITLEIGRLDTNWVAQLTLVDVDNGQTSTSLRKVFAYGDLRRLATEGLPELAQQLQQEEAAWFNLTMSPSNATLSVDGSPTASLTSRLPLNPGKHVLCAQSPGYASQCKEFTVKKNDAVTYAFLLKAQGVKGGVAESQAAHRELIEDEDSSADAASAPPSRVIWWTLGGMGALALVLVLVLNSKD